MGACIARCWPLIADPRYQPVRSRYFIQDDTVQAQPRRRPRISFSSDESLCMSGDDDPPPSGDLEDFEDDLPLPLGPSEVNLLTEEVQITSPLQPACKPIPTGLPLPLSPPLLTGSPPPLTGSPLSPPLPTGSPPLVAESPPTSQSSSCLLADSQPSTPMSASPPALVGFFPCQPQYYNLIPKPAEDEVELARHLETQGISDPPSCIASSSIHKSASGGQGRGGGRFWTPKGVPGSLPSLTEPDSPPTASIDLEWEPEAGLTRVSRESLGEEEASQTAESSSWVPRSACSTPNSLEWDFRASTLSLRGGVEDETWHHTDMETEQLIHEIEQLTARALADTGHGLQPAPR